MCPQRGWLTLLALPPRLHVRAASRRCRPRHKGPRFHTNEAPVKSRKGGIPGENGSETETYVFFKDPKK